jgi:hypothetical protein
MMTLSCALLVGLFNLGFVENDSTHIKRIAAIVVLFAIATSAAEAKTKTKQSSRAKHSSHASRAKSSKTAATAKKKIEVKSDTESLYEAKAAKKIDPAQLSFFGPLASKFRYDKRMVRAAELAAARAYAHSHGSCWRYVKDALLSAGLVDSRPKTAYAKEAGSELADSYGFKKIRVSDPYKAPLGSVLVYGGRGAGHVEFRTKTGFVSDFSSPTPSKRPLIGVYIKS